VTGAQAADLPVKAKAVQYVKICSLYGAGFYYIPGTDTCIRVSGYVRSDYGYNVTGSMAPHYFGAGGAQDRGTSPYSTRHRGRFQFDSRTQTSYGTLRTYEAFNIENREGTVSVAVTRAFIQWAGFTFGRTVSVTDVPGTPGDNTFKALHQTQVIHDTGANGTNQIAYTWELGNGMTLNIGADERRVKGIANLSTATLTAGANPASSSGGQQHPDPWVNFAVNQAWGRYGLSFIAHKNNATYYGANDTTGYPEDKWGFAVLTGIDIKAPWFGPGDHFGGFFQYGRGASSFGAGNNLTSPGLFGGINGSGLNTVAIGFNTDAVYVVDSGLELTTTWTAGGGFEHFWLPNFSTTVYGTYTDVSYNDNVVNNSWFCRGGANGITINTPGVACDPSFRFWTIGSHTDWYPVRGFRLAAEVLYTRIETAFDGASISLGKTSGLRHTGDYTAKDDGIVSVVFRAQREF
jgi:hypothetical protein